MLNQLLGFSAEKNFRMNRHRAELEFLLEGFFKYRAQSGGLREKKSHVGRKENAARAQELIPQGESHSILFMESELAFHILKLYLPIIINKPK